MRSASVSSVFSELQSDAAEIMGEFTTGQVIYTEPETAGATPYDPATPGASHTINGAISVRYKAKRYDDRLSSATLEVKFPHIDPATGAPIAFEPVESGTVTVSGIERQIVAIEKNPADGDIVSWSIYVMG